MIAGLCASLQLWDFYWGSIGGICMRPRTTPPTPGSDCQSGSRLIPTGQRTSNAPVQRYSYPANTSNRRSPSFPNIKTAAPKADSNNLPQTYLSRPCGSEKAFTVSLSASSSIVT